MGDGSQTAASAYGASVGSGVGALSGGTGSGTGAAVGRMTATKARPRSATSNLFGQTATAVGGVASAFAEYSSGRKNQRISRINARMAEEQARQAVESGDIAANRVLVGQRVAEGGQRAAEASSGIVAGAGTSAMVSAADRAAAMEDARTIQLNARRQAYGYKVKAEGDRFQGRLSRRSGDLSAVETLMNTGSKLWLQADRNQHIDFA